jgi:CHAD domain-containing protein
MHMDTLLLDSLNARWDNYKTGLKTCRREYSEEAVHDFRVAARRLLSSLDLLRTVMQDPRIKKIRWILKDQLDKLDDLRNTQVLLVDISGTIQENPVLQPYQEYLQLREKKLLRAARKAIKSLKVASLSKRIKKLNETIQTLKQTDLDMGLFLAIQTSQLRSIV